MMWNHKKSGLTAAAIVASAAIAGGGVLAAHAEGDQSTTATVPSATSTASPSTATSTATITKAAKGNKDRGDLRAAVRRLKDIQHATWVAKKGANGPYVTHDAIRGAVTAVSPSSITVKSGDGVSQTYGLTSTTKITVAGAAGTKPSSGTTADVRSGITVLVIGTGTSSLTADRVVVPAA